MVKLLNFDSLGNSLDHYRYCIKGKSPTFDFQIKIDEILEQIIDFQIDKPLRKKL